jgi:plasmid stabilization system protein ParE
VTARVIYHPDFETDVSSAASWLNEARAGFGEIFSSEVRETAGRVVSFPESFGVIEEEFRRAVIRRFHYLLVYRLAGNELQMVGVVHGARDLKSWLEERTRT